MAEVNPPLVLEGGSHDSDLLRQLWGDTYTEGVVGVDHLEVTEQSTPALGVTVAAGRAFVDGTEAASQGVYYVRNDAAADVGLATADATNARIDLIVARVKDSFYSGGDDEWALEAVTGTPAGSPSAPAAPANSLVLAEVTVPADGGGNPAITDSDIEDMRTQARTGGAAPGGVLGYAQVTSNQGSISTETDLTGLTVTVDVAAGRRIRITGYCRALSNIDNSNLSLLIKESSTQLQRADAGVGPNATHRATLVPVVVLTPSEGSHTYKLAGLPSASATMTMLAASTHPASITVEDLGPA